MQEIGNSGYLEGGNIDQKKDENEMLPSTPFETYLKILNCAMVSFTQ